MRDLIAFVADVHAGRADPGEAVAEAELIIRARNPELCALVDYDPDIARPQLDALRARLAAGERPPLAGLPVTVKDHIHVEGWPVTEGSARLQDRVALRDDLAVARLRAAGAIVTGRTNMSEFGCKGVTTNRLYGPTRHPLDPVLTPGGSSGGAAVATASGMCALALAGDGGGSVRRPAAHVGVVGFKPSGGAVPHPGALSHTAVLGLMAQNVALVARAFHVLRGRHVTDPFSVDLPGDGRDPRTLKLGWAPLLGIEIAADAEALAAGQTAIERIAAQGYDIAPATPRWPEGACEEAMMPLQHAALATRWGEDWRRDPSIFDIDIAEQIEAGLALRAVDVMRAEQMSRAIAAAAAAFFAEGPDLLLSLTTPCAAWPLNSPGPERIGGRPAGPRGHAGLTPFANHALLPAISVPCGTDALGLPYGLQIIGPRLSDAALLSAAALLAPIIAAH